MNFISALVSFTGPILISLQDVINKPYLGLISVIAWNAVVLCTWKIISVIRYAVLLKFVLFVANICQQSCVYTQ